MPDPDLRTLSWTDLLKHAGSGIPGSQRSYQVELELQRRQTEAQLEAAAATIETARYTRHSAFYMGASVVVLTLASIVTGTVAVLDYLYKP